MSRSLDPAVLESLRAQDPRPAYKDISSLFAQGLDTTSQGQAQLLEIEFLGTSHPLEQGVSYLRDGHAVAIPKLRLAQAFMVARQILHEDLMSRHAGLTILEKVLPATAVLLLMDPEHITAANTRKRALRCKLSSLEKDDAKARLDAVNHEKHFVDSLLTSRLHRHTKSPTLWNHRRWLLELGKSEGRSLDLEDELKRVIMVSGERHPRNYYAWNHARWLLTEHVTTKSPAVGDVRANMVHLCHIVKDWCLKHHGDISGWSFLGFILNQIHDEDEQTTARNIVARDVLKITESFRWSNESVWVFLRSLAATQCLEKEVSTSLQALGAKLGSL
ncbi:uncharacterized protein B0I36DRAFT_310766 [Microdochium trichocladiopsis]|uniref:Protein prenyltransferase n=1 Tax=Microdochium trichocladiopsis TaxID=1682393 RepID=A0A9P8YH86_9PEZI|nr:uncharacterized protein B0I36DRAFT_310766 [Microdochium trichocladiopsis]KAH7040476.1 hypothetical protein B0I36DRAFT_310766 [Microdochium trichocladiopsis]